MKASARRPGRSGRASRVATLAAVVLAFAPALALADAAFAPRVTFLGDSHAQAIRGPGEVAPTGATAQLSLCDCEAAQGEPGNLSCEKDGFFVADFEHIGSWMLGGGLVPLSPAVCCRPCLPDPQDPPTGLPDFKDDPPVAVVSLGCHTASGRGNDAVMCESSSTVGYFATGFADGSSISVADSLYFPYAPLSCCSPALLLRSGRAFRITRCGCRSLPSGVGCGGPEQGLSVVGYGGTRRSRDGDVVPVAPVECCGMCVGDEVPAEGGCEALDDCNGHGACRLGVCECHEGWGGADCRFALRDGSGGFWSMPAWLLVVMVVGAATGVSVLGALVAKVYADTDGFQRMPWEGAESDDDSDTRPLLCPQTPAPFSALGRTTWGLWGRRTLARRMRGTRSGASREPWMPPRRCPARADTPTLTPRWNGVPVRAPVSAVSRTWRGRTPHRSRACGRRKGTGGAGWGWEWG